MRLLRGVGIGILAGAFALGWAGAARAQSGQNSSQQNGNGTTTPSSGSNVPYNPPTSPAEGYGNATTGSYSGKGSTGYGNGPIGNPSPSIGRMGKDNPLADDTPESQQQMEMQQARARNAERQKQLVADTQRLVALATELEDEVNKSSKDMLSLDVVRKADEIDKLARTVRDKMKNAN